MTPLPLYKEFPRDFFSECCYTLLQLRHLPVLLILDKRIQIGDHKIEIVKFSDSINTLLKDITCLNRI